MTIPTHIEHDCPFCGNSNADTLINAKDGQKYRIWCELCGALGPPGDARLEAAQKWKVRAGEQRNPIPPVTDIPEENAFYDKIDLPQTQQQTKP